MINTELEFIFTALSFNQTVRFDDMTCSFTFPRTKYFHNASLFASEADPLLPLCVTYELQLNNNTKTKDYRPRIMH